MALWPVVFMPSGEISDKYRVTEQETKIKPVVPVAEIVARWLYSPGQVHKAHQIPQLNCSHCHSLMQPVAQEKCSQCHRPVDFQRRSQPLLIDTHRLINNMDCMACHWEHKGQKGQVSAVFDGPGHEKYLAEEILIQCDGCHSDQGRKAHPTLTNDGLRQCNQCHETSDWSKTAWDHLKIEQLQFTRHEFVKLVLPLPDEVCRSCHGAGFHGEKADTDRPTEKTPLLRLQTEELTGIPKGTFDCLTCHNF